MPTAQFILALAGFVRRLSGSLAKDHALIGDREIVTWVPVDRALAGVNGGDDGAQTRDLCRDRSRKLMNLNNFMSADG